MSYLIQEPTTFINIKLTDTGRRLLSLGQLTFNKFGFSDREVDYKIGRTSYSICSNAILAPKDEHPIFSMNFDGTSFADLDGQQVGSARQIASAQTQSTGFFSAGTNGYTLLPSWIDSGYGNALGKATLIYTAHTPSGHPTIYLETGGYSANTGDLVYIPWEPIEYSAITNTSDFVPSGAPTVALWYRVTDTSNNGTVLDVDRDIPSFSGYGVTTQAINAYFYPYNGIENYYGSAMTVNTRVWNMNIVRTSSEIGTTDSMSGYTTYGSIIYNGTKLYLGFSSETRMIGIVHYTNEFTGNTYAEQFVETTVSVTIPNLMWHLRPGATNGTQLEQGITFSDAYGTTTTDTVANTTYRELRDGTSYTSNVVGRVYHKLKLIVFTDQELITALTYKCNRNYTLPALNLTLSPSPKNPLTTTTASGLCLSNFSYFVTYVTQNTSPNAAGASYGYPQPFHCNYIQKIDGLNDVNGNAQYLAASFAANSFPYLRNSSNMTALSGTGWSMNKMQLIVKEIPTSAYTGIGDLETDDWVLISNGVGNGIYTGETGQTCIDPLYLQNFQFIISREDYESGTTYTLSGIYSAFTMNMDSVYASGLTFGDESFFFGNISAGIKATTFKSVITLYARNNEFNSSLNPSFDGTEDEDTYITEFGVFNSNGDLVAVGKPSYPIQKNSSRFLVFQLELDF